MDDDTQRLFQRVAGKLGWTKPGGLDATARELLRSVGKSEQVVPGRAGSGKQRGDASPPAVQPPTTRRQLSDSESEGGSTSEKENEQRRGQNRARRDSSDEVFVLTEKVPLKPAAQRQGRPLTGHSEQVLSSDSDGSFDDYLSRLHTPKLKPLASLEDGSDDRAPRAAALDSSTRDLFQRVAGKLGWSNPGGLESAEQELLRSVGKSEQVVPGRAGSGKQRGDASPPAVQPPTTRRQLSDSESEGGSTSEKETENEQRRGQNRARRDSSDEVFVLTEKVPLKPAAQRQGRPLTGHSPSEQVLSSGSDGSFEDFLSRLQTPKPKSSVLLGGSSDNSLQHFIVSDGSSGDDFVTEKKKLPHIRGHRRTPASQPAARRPPSRRERPIFLSDSDDEGGAGRITWGSRKGGVPQRLNSAGLEEEEEEQQQQQAVKPKSTPSAPAPSRRAQSETAQPPRLDSSDSSNEEFESLLARIRKNRGVGVGSTHTPPAASKEPKPCLSLPPAGGQGSRPAERAAQLEVTPVHPTVKRPVVSQTEPRAANSKRIVLCKTPGCFLESLSDPRSSYVRGFKQTRQELSQKLYQLYNSTVFDSKLPAMSVIWNKKMRKTAGYCVTGQQQGQRYARIELSEKVCDSAERLRDTLVHEMCHAATWMINGVRDGHGQFWKMYARKATVVHPELPMVTRCHSYDINYKYQYQCSRCKNTVGRHSKSLDTQKFVCALCTGQLVLLTPAKSRGATPFATFVKEHYGTVRQELQGQGHAEVMRKLSADFAKTRLADP
ncbi:germ cell nuclear acidic protein [Lepisosteus oculatus]|uniref:germ cell nuclear acidic protein n=1 Tax=Lepisosteus oculatus TaxID=7918 RepID=UPI0037142A41